MDDCLAVAVESGRLREGDEDLRFECELILLDDDDDDFFVNDSVVVLVVVVVDVIVVVLEFWSFCFSLFVFSLDLS